MTHTAQVIELTEFQLNPAAAAAQLADACAKLDAFLADQPGFVARRLLRDGATLADLIQWRDLAAAQAAKRAAEASPEAGAYFALIDMGTVRMRHFRIER